MLVNLAFKVLGGEHGRDDNLRVVTKAEAHPICDDLYHHEEKSQRFAEVAFERNLKSNTDLL